MARLHPFARYEVGERPGKGNFVVAEQPADHLRDQHPQQCQHRQRPQWRESGLLSARHCCPQVAPQAAGRRHSWQRDQRPPTRPHTRRNASSASTTSRRKCHNMALPPTRQSPEYRHHAGGQQPVEQTGGRPQMRNRWVGMKTRGRCWRSQIVRQEGDGGVCAAGRMLPLRALRRPRGNVNRSRTARDGHGLPPTTPKEVPP